MLRQTLSRTLALGLSLCGLLTLSTAHGATDALLLSNIHGYRVDASGRHTFSALLVENGKVRAYDDSAMALADSLHAQRLDGAGNVVLPGLIDAHGHVQDLGQEQMQVDLRGSTTLQDALNRITAFTRHATATNWLQGRGWNQVLWPGQQFPTAADLDHISATQPIVMERVDGHAIWVNSAALKVAGVNAQTVDPAGGQIIRDSKGNPAGVFVDNAMSLILDRMPPASADERRQQLLSALNALAKLGMTGVHDAGIPYSDYQLYQQLGQRQQLPIRVYAMLADSPTDRKWLQQPPGPAQFDNRLYLQALKIVADGALGSRGAAMLADYSDQPQHRGLMLYTAAELQAVTALAVNHGWQVNIHAIGDAGNQRVLDTFAAVLRDDKARALRHRIEHAQVLALTDIPRFKALNVIASIQPTHATSDMNMAETRIGPERIKGAYAWRKLLNAGAHLAGGSDFPVEYANPFYGLHAAVTRRDRDGQPPGGWYPDEKLSRDEALKLFTFDAAYAARMENLTGSLAIGQYADFIIVDRDFFTVPEQEIATTEVLSTWLAGKKIYSGAD
ncbi:amidohydrolase [Permianibacter sp. IMCC34836]|uniref:amidohydrolase n=1 Tax=Permianibacter fluminis TaxID=2738515 RepID=UPI0015581554|nr:amidohydrolase [Permianibacter fluminis]NQD38595.1 amidohydrolase [Permianibacter fluminis]